MSEPKHSPAPWTWKKVDGTRSSWLYDAEGDQICHSVITPDPPDAALIVASPDLLEACKIALEHDDFAIETDPFYRMTDEDRAVLVAAIAKAEGK